MALLIYLFCFLSFIQPVEASFPAEDVPRAVLFDSGGPQNSVGIMGKNFVEAGDDYEHYQVVGFEPRVILLKDYHTDEITKIPAEDRFNAKIIHEARHRFVVKQLRAIYKAQIAYIAKHGNHYAKDLDTLIYEEFLSDGFSLGIKQDYYFRIAETKAEFKKEPVFFAVATPVKSIQPDLLFSVDQLGLVRYAETIVHLPWGPAWDYVDHNPGQSFYIGSEKLTKN